jgi:hypothetical protein
MEYHSAIKRNKDELENMKARHKGHTLHDGTTTKYSEYTTYRDKKAGSCCQELQGERTGE